MFSSFQKIQNQAITSQKRDKVEQLLHFYIVPDCSLSINDETRLEILEVIKEFLENEQEKVLLVLSEVGLGKTSLTLKLEYDFWRRVEERKFEEGEYLPIRIELRSYNTANVQGCIEDALKKKYKLTKNEIQKLKQDQNVRILMLFDGYDEIAGYAKCKFYEEVGLQEWLQAKAIVTCRSQHFMNERQYKKYFVLYDENHTKKVKKSLRMIYIVPFSAAQIEMYLQRYEGDSRGSGEISSIAKIRELIKNRLVLKELLSHPFVLSVFFSVVENILLKEKIKSIKPF